MKDVFEDILAGVANFPSAAEVFGWLALIASAFVAAGVFIGWLIWA